MRFLQSKHHLTKPWKQQFQCKMEAWITKHNGTAHAIFQRSPPRSADNGDHFCAIWAHPERARRMDEVPCIDAGSHFVQENTEFHVISRIQTSLDKTLEAAIPMQNASLDHQTQWHRACNLSKITSAQRWQCAIRAHPERQPHPSHRRGFPASTPGATLHEKHKVSPAISSAQKRHHPSKRWKQPFQCKI